MRGQERIEFQFRCLANARTGESNIAGEQAGGFFKRAGRGLQQIAAEEIFAIAINIKRVVKIEFVFILYQFKLNIAF